MSEQNKAIVRRPTKRSTRAIWGVVLAASLTGTPVLVISVLLVAFVAMKVTSRLGSTSSDA